MKKRLINVVKWFFITLGVLFFIQFILILGAILGLVSFANFDFKAHETKTNIKPFENVIKYLDKYSEENGKYPQNIDSIKTDKNYDFEYKTSNNDSCYVLSAKSKKTQMTKEYQKCSIKSDNSISTSQSYIEYSNK